MTNPYAHPMDSGDDFDGPARVSGLAVASLVFGILCCIPVVGLIAVILGAAALITIRKSEGRLGGKTLAIVAIVLGGVGTLAWIVFAIAATQFYSAYRRGAMEPTYAAMTALDARDTTPAKALLDSKTRTRVTDAEWTAFTDSYTAKFGAFQGTMYRLDFSLISAQPPLGTPAHTAFIPVPAEFKQEPAVIFLFADSPDALSDVIQGGTANGHITNILILGRGKHVWLIDPSKLGSGSTGGATGTTGTTAPTGVEAPTGPGGPRSR